MVLVEKIRTVAIPHKLGLVKQSSFCPRGTQGTGAREECLPKILWEEAMTADMVENHGSVRGVDTPSALLTHSVVVAGLFFLAQLYLTQGCNP